LLNLKNKPKMRTFKIALPDNETEEVVISETFEIKGRTFCVHQRYTFDTYTVSDYLTGRLIEQVSGFDSLAMVTASAKMFLEGISEKKWKEVFENTPVINP